MKILNYKFQILLFILSFLILTKFNIDPDLGWHLAIGERFLRGGEIVRGDPFSWTMPGYEFGNYFFLYQITVSFLFNKLGYILTAILFGILVSAGVLLLLPKTLSFWKVLAGALGVVLASFSLGIRPSTVSFGLFSLLLVLLERRFFSSRMSILVWFVFFAVWANFHQGFIVGLFVLAMFLVIDFFWQKQKTKDEILFSFFCILAAFAGSLVTPFHIHLWQSVLSDLVGSNTWLAVAEYQPLPIYTPVNLLYAFSGVIFIYTYFKKFMKLEPGWLLLAAAIFTLPILAFNMVIFWTAIFIFFVTRHLDFDLELRGNFLAQIALIFPSLAVFMTIFLVFATSFLVSVNLRRRFIMDQYPVQAVEFLKKNKLTDGAFNSYGWGGYIDWQAPEIKVFIDGRMTGWRKADGGYILSDAIAIQSGDCDLAKRYDIRLVLMKTDFKNDCFWDFREVYKDQIAKILVKN